MYQSARDVSCVLLVCAHVLFRFRFCFIMVFASQPVKKSDLDAILSDSDSDVVYYLIASQPVKKSNLDAIGGQRGLGFTRMYTRTARVIGPTQVSPVPPSVAGF